MSKETCQPKENYKMTGMHNIKVCKQNTKKEKQQKGLMYIQIETKSKAKTLNGKTEQQQQMIWSESKPP